MLELNDSRFSYLFEERSWEGSVLIGLVFKQSIK